MFKISPYDIDIMHFVRLTRFPRHSNTTYSKHLGFSQILIFIGCLSRQINKEKYSKEKTLAL